MLLDVMNMSVTNICVVLLVEALFALTTTLVSAIVNGPLVMIPATPTLILGQVRMEDFNFLKGVKILRLVDTNSVYTYIVDEPV